MNYAGILSPLGGWVKRIKALQNKLKPERYVQQNTDNDGGNRARSRHVCGLGRHTYTLSVMSKQPAWEIAQDDHHSHT